MTTQQPIFRTSAEAVRLKRLLAEIPQGDTISYAEIRELIGVDPQSDKGRGICATAIRQVRNESQSVFACIANTGFKRLPDAEIADLGSSIIKGIGRKARRGAHIVSCADSAKLTPPQKIQQLATQTVCAMVARATENKTYKAIVSSVTNSNRALEYKEAMIAAIK